MSPPFADTCLAPSAQAEPRHAPDELWRRYHQEAEPETENELIGAYLPLVKTVVGRLALTLPSHVNQDDLHSAALVGLLQAVRKYNPKCGASFETYARLRIRGAILDELRRMDWVPRPVHDKARKIQNAIGRLEQRLGAVPTEAQVARELEIPVAEYQSWLEEIRPATFVCLDAAIDPSHGDGTDHYDTVPDDTQEGPWECASRRELIGLMTERLQQLPETQRKVLALYYFEDLRLREIAAAFGVTESRISQIHSQAILSIRSFLERREAGGGKPALACA